MAKKVESSLEGTVKKVSYTSKPTPNQNAKEYRNVDNVTKRGNEYGSRGNLKPPNTLTMDQNKTLGLCFKCNEKWQIGHRCSNRIINTIDGVGIQT
jgi:hypothetical protein